MKRRTVALIIAAILVILVAGLSYAAYFANRINPPHTPAGLAIACGTTIPGTDLRTFHIVPKQTTASYKVHEHLFLYNLPNHDAIGKTHAVQGMFRLRTGTSPLLADMKVTVDLRTLQSDDDQRDFYVGQDYLHSNIYPFAEFTSTCAQGLPTTYHDGQAIRFQITGNLKVHGKTNKEIFTVQGRVAGNTVTGTASTTVYMTDFGIQPPNLAITLAENKVLLTITFAAKEG